MKKIDYEATDSRILTFLEGLWDDAFNYRKDTNFGKNGIRWYEQYAGLHWDSSKVRKGKAAIVLNQTGATIEDIFSEITDSPPLFDTFAEEEKFQDEAETLKDTFNNFLWKNSGMDIEQQLSIKSSLIVGSGHIRTECNPDTRILKSRFISPFSCFPAPGATRMSEMPYYIQARLVPRILLQENIGDEINDIRKTRDIAYEFLPDMEREAAKGLVAGLKDFGRQISHGLGFISGRMEGMSDQDNLLLREYWVKDLTRNKAGERVYPTWRYYARVEDVVLKTPPSIWQYPFIPIIKTDDYVTEGYWGRGEVEWMESPQYLVNKFISQICNYMDMVANPPVKAEKGAGVPENWITGAGRILHINTGFFDRVDFMRVPALPSEFLALLSTLFKIIDDITGQHAGMPVRSATQAAIFSESQQQRIKPKVRNMENGLLEWAEQMKEYIKQHWAKERKIVFRAPSGEIVRKSFNDKQVLDTLNMSITTGSTMASNRLTRMTQIAQIPELDLLTRLETMNFPNAKQVVQRVEAKKGEIAQLTMQLTQMVQENEGLKKQLMNFR